MDNPIPKIKKYYGETTEEVKKCSWPNRQDLIQHTMLVIGATLVLTAFIFVTDFALKNAVTAIFKIPTMSTETDKGL